MDSLQEYRKKRDFTRTKEPSGPDPDDADLNEATGEGGRFVIQKHDASRLHYDLRLEKDGVYKSWAVPKGPSLKLGEKRLAVEVEDHPLEYGTFEGTIPEGEYGGGTVMLWDQGRWTPFEGGKIEQGRFDFVLAGEKLRGAWSLIRTSGGKAKKSNWLLIKRSDNGKNKSEVHDLSIKTGRTMEQIANDEAPADDDSVTVPDAREIPKKVKKALSKSPQASLATLVKKAPEGPDWVHEIKFDGYRILTRFDNGKVQLISRNGKDWTKKFPELAKQMEKLSCDKALLDGEVVAYEADGTTSFRALQEALSAKSTKKLSYQLFDILHLDGYDLLNTPLTARKSALSGVIEAAGFDENDPVRYTEHVHGQGPEFANHACRLGLEGIISKRAEGGYRSGRSRDWLKIKCTGREELLICGYTEPSGSRSGFGALLLGAWHNKKLRYAGKVGTGFNQRMLTDLSNKLKKIELKKSKLDNPPAEPGIHWVKPVLIAEVEFTNWTRDGALRHPAFMGLREDRKADEVMLPEAALGSKPETKQEPAKKTAGGKKAVKVAGVKLSSPDKILYPEQGITKLALAEYYQEIESWILPQISHRPLSLVRCPGGHTKQCFFQKHPGSTVSKTVERFLIEEKDGKSPYVYIEKIEDIIALVQVGALELHTWGSRIEDIERPDTLVFDLDPAPDVSLPETFKIAHDLRERLEDLGLQSFPRTTGGKGVHLVVPITPKYTWDEIKAFCRGVAKAHASDNSKRVTANMSKAKRQGRIFLDYLRNGRGATAIASFSARARPGAPVAVPIGWDEVTGDLRPDRYNVENLRRRLSALSSDPWADYDEARGKISSKAMNAMEKVK